MATSSSYVWRYDLSDYALTTDVSNDYTARVSTNKSMTIEDIASEIASERTDLRVDTLVMAANLIADKIGELVCQGYTVVTGTALYQPTITGTFIGNSGTFDSERNSCVCTVSASQALREKVATVSPQFTGTVKESGGARISLVVDATTGSNDGTITSGGVLTVTGTKIKCVNADGSDIGVVSFVNAETLETAATVSLLVVNDPSKLIFTCPTLEAGEYILRIETYYSNSAVLLKSARQIESGTLSVVVASEDEEEDDDEYGDA